MYIFCKNSCYITFLFIDESNFGRTELKQVIRNNKWNWADNKNQYSPSFNMPTLRHFMKRQAWHDLRLLLVISHSLVAGQLYSIFPEEDEKNSSSLSLWVHKVHISNSFLNYCTEKETKSEMANKRPQTDSKRHNTYAYTHTHMHSLSQGDPAWHSWRRGGFSGVLMGHVKSTSPPWNPTPILIHR